MEIAWWAARLKARMRRCLIPVSYTHLLVSRKQLIGWGMDTLSGLADKGEVLRPFAETPQRKRPPGGPNGMARPGAFINCCPSVLECGDAVVCSEVPTFRYELALGQAEQEMAEHGRSAHCP